ncbi:MAG: alanine dehydrogenase [Myxococcota bacterium]
MIVGVPKEIKPQEARVGVTPSGVDQLVKRGHAVLIESGAGIGSGIADDEYVRQGAVMVSSADELWSRAEMIWKVKEPIAPEYARMRPGQIIYAYLHLAPDLPQTQALVDAGVIAVAFETIETADRRLPLLAPMSEVAGRLSVQAGARTLERPQGGRGVLLGGVPGVPPGRVAVIGGGVVGINAARMAMGLGADVTVLDVNLERLRWIDHTFGGRIKTQASSPHAITEYVNDADLIIGAVLVTGARAPHLIRREHLATMKADAVLVDVAVDQGGCAETTRPTTHAEPTYIVDGVVHYAVANMPGAVPRTSTFALHNATMPYAVRIADLGWESACAQDSALAKGLNVVRGRVTHQAVAESHGMTYSPWSA